MALTLSNQTVVYGSAFNATVLGAAAGSTLALTTNPGGRWSFGSRSLSCSNPQVDDVPVVTETLAGGGGSTGYPFPLVIKNTPSTLRASGTPAAAMVGQSTAFSPTITGGTPPYSMQPAGRLPAGRAVEGLSVAGPYLSAGPAVYEVIVGDAAGATVRLPVRETISGLGVPTIAHREFFTRGSYSAYASMFATLGNPSYAYGQDHYFNWQFDKPTFPSNVGLYWKAPTGAIPNGLGVWGYAHIDYANYDESVQQVQVTPRQVAALTAMTQNFNWSYTGSANFNILSEIWLTNAPHQVEGNSGNASTLFEIGFLLHAVSANFHNSGALIGTTHVNNGVTYTARNHGGIYPFITFMRQSGADLLSGTINWKAALNFLQAQGVLTGAEWINGIGFGVEPDAGGGEGAVTFNDITAVLTGTTGPQSLLTNGDFSNDDVGWGGFYYSGKSIVAGQAAFINAPAYDGINQPVSLIVGKYYEVTFTVSNRTAGTIYAQFVGGNPTNGTVRNANGTYTQRLLAQTSNNTFQMQADTGPATLNVDNISVIGPYNTATVGGA